MKQLANVLDRLFKDPELKNHMYKGMVVSVWEKAVGKKIAGICQPTGFENGTLYVKVQSAAWRNELTMMRTTIKDKINELLGLPIVRSIIFR